MRLGDLIYPAILSLVFGLFLAGHCSGAIGFNDFSIGAFGFEISVDATSELAPLLAWSEIMFLLALLHAVFVRVCDQRALHWETDAKQVSAARTNQFRDMQIDESTRRKQALKVWRSARQAAPFILSVALILIVAHILASNLVSWWPSFVPIKCPPT